jgi:hypothetical protein
MMDEPEKTSNKIAEPLSRLYTILSIVLLALFTMIGVNYQRDHTTLLLAQEAMIAARSARPYPYTSQMAKADLRDIEVRLRILNERCAGLVANQAHLDKRTTNIVNKCCRSALLSK